MLVLKQKIKFEHIPFGFKKVVCYQSAYAILNNNNLLLLILFCTKSNVIK